MNDLSNYYIFISSTEITPYNGEILKRYVGSKLIKIISNPTERDLVEFGYKPLIKEEIPTYDEETEYIEKTYLDEVDRIVEHYEVKPIPEPEELENIENIEE